MGFVSLFFVWDEFLLYLSGKYIRYQQKLGTFQILHTIYKSHKIAILYKNKQEC